MVPISPENEAKLRLSHTQQVEKFISQIKKFTENNFAISIQPDGNVISYTCTPNFIEYADNKSIDELKMLLELLQKELHELDKNKFWAAKQS